MTTKPIEFFVVTVLRNEERECWVVEVHHDNGLNKFFRDTETGANDLATKLRKGAFKF